MTRIKERESASTLMSRPAVEVQSLVQRYGDVTALAGISFSVQAGEIFGLVGPNGGGKSTVFKILTTLIRPTSGNAKIFGHDVLREPASVRMTVGVVFQSPALDKKLTVTENLIHQGHLYGLWGKELKQRTSSMLERLGLTDRSKQRVEHLSGGLKRRLEIAKGLLHRPRLLILDEPTTGLDPLVRRDVWEYLKQLRKDEGMTVLLTTHLLEEAEFCDKLLFLHQGNAVAIGSPSELKASLGGDILCLRAKSPEKLKRLIHEKFGLSAMLVEGTLRIERKNGHELVPLLVSAFSEQIESVTLGKPTLEDLFIQKTGHRFWQESEEQ